MGRTLADAPTLLMAKAADFDENECWLWAGAKNDMGYGQIRIAGTLYYVHILSYVTFVEPVPEGYEVDHRCHDPHVCIGGPRCPHRPCFNFRHLLAVTGPENSARSVSRVRTHCPQGHPYDEENTAHYNGTRFCRKCHTRRQAARKKAQRAARGPIPPRTHCKNGHPFSGDNLYVTSEGHRKCRACKREHMARVRSEAKVVA